MATIIAQKVVSETTETRYQIQVWNGVWHVDAVFAKADMAAVAYASRRENYEAEAVRIVEVETTIVSTIVAIGV